MLEVRNLTIHHGGRNSAQSPAVQEVSFALSAAETLGLVGESGCGKTTLALALMGMLPRSAHVKGGSVRFGGHDILRAPERVLRSLRGAEVSLVFQEPALSLNPVMRVGDQIAEVWRAHYPGDRRHRRALAEAGLSDVGLHDRRFYPAYPHQLSSGQRQRVAIAQALICKPAFLIADEPTSALDNVTQAEVVELLKNLRQRSPIALLFITHNPALLRGLADRVMIMRAGRIVEQGSFVQVAEKPQHSYTESLFQALPPLACQNGGNVARARSAVT